MAGGSGTDAKRGQRVEAADAHRRFDTAYFGVYMHETASDQ